MNYVNHIDAFGVAARQLPCQVGSGEPTTVTEGAVGELYMDALTGRLYRCTAASGGVYVWQYNVGDTPVKGTDYFTDGDKAELVEAVLAALPDGDEVSY